MPINENWHRWVYESVSKHLHDALDADLEIIVENTDRRGPNWKNANTKAEATISGPRSKQSTPREYRIRAEVFVVVTSLRSTNDHENHIDACGKVANALDQCILCVDWSDTGLLTIGQLDPRLDEEEDIDLEHLKPKETDQQVFTTIQARYEGLFTE